MVVCKKKQDVFVKHYAPGGNKVKKNLFLAYWSQSRSQGHRPWCHLKELNQWSMHPKYEVPISYGSKVMAKSVKSYF